jgi:ectoine hydroxylase-related dioxygenase (phytanoyl-CoA dioxygenase family)
MEQSMLTADQVRTYRETGVLGPFPLLDDSGVERLMAAYRAVSRERVEFGPFAGLKSKGIRSIEEYFSKVGTEYAWFKSLHTACEPVRELAGSALIVERARSILGPALMLWGSEIVMKEPAQIHRWHVDVETRRWPSMNVWIGLENVNRNCSLKIIPGSHRYAESPQELETKIGLNIKDDDDVLRAARRFDPAAQILVMDLKPGEFYMFEGSTWHGSDNTTDKIRSALLFQYSMPMVEPKIPISFGIPTQWHDYSPPVVHLR